MSTQFSRLFHSGRPGPSVPHEPHAALLIDFDNVTMGIRSDITKELKNLLNSDIIKGKVAVQRAYADWRRYPQYVVPLAEASIDLIFAPAYGSSKKNATDIRLAIDALELVFTRPEIGTLILLSGDSDFSSLVLKLKEYGKYVIGVGIRESASDLLVQNCDEYYSYSALTGLTRAGEEESAVTSDPWELVDIAVRQMVTGGDVMRSDRLKQVLLELDPNFDEKQLGFSKFNRFVAEAANRGLLHLQKMENGQFEITLADGQEPPPAAARPERARGRGRRRDEKPLTEKKAPERDEPKAADTGPLDSVERPAPKPRAETRDVQDAKAGLPTAYDLLRRAAKELGGTPERAVRDSDVKRRMLDLDPDFDESIFGFSKFSRFLRQAHDAELINLRKIDNGNYELTLPDGQGAPGAVARAADGVGTEPAREDRSESQREEQRRGRRGRRGVRNEDRDRQPRGDADQRKPRDRTGHAKTNTVIDATTNNTAPGTRPGSTAPATGPTSTAPAIPAAARDSRSTASTAIGLRRGSRGARPGGPPPLLEGQAIGARSPSAAGPKSADVVPADPSPPAARPGFAPGSLGLPVKKEAVVEYLTKAYKGIGRKSAEHLIEAVGAANVFTTLAEQPDRIRQVLGDKRGATLLDAWTEDFARRSGGRRRGVRAGAES
ncbi:MAG: NYN domain-containing protein [Longimicrobiales bacterium]